MSVCIFAGTFDPITKGHLAIIKKLLKDYSRVLVVVGENGKKTTLFSSAERFEIVKSALKGIRGTEVVCYADKEKNYAEFLREKGAFVYARGIRNQTDLKYEQAAEEINKKLYPEIRTVYYTAKDGCKNLSSTMIRERIKAGKDFKPFVPKSAYPVIRDILKKREN